MRTIAAATLAFFLVACGDAPAPKPDETPADPPAEQASAQKTLRVEYYEINKK